MALATVIASVGVIVVAGVASNDCWMAVVASVCPSVAMMAMVAAARMEVHFMILGDSLGCWIGMLCAADVKCVVSLLDGVV